MADLNVTDGDRERAREWFTRARIGSYVTETVESLAVEFAKVREECARVADGWLAEYAGYAPKHIGPNKWANDAVRDIAAAIRGQGEQVD